MTPWILLAVLAIVLISAAVFWLTRRAQPAGPDLHQARRSFHLQREHLEAKFFELAAASGRPRGLRWSECDFANPVSFARDCTTGELTALVGVTISFEAIEGGGMEEVEAVGNLRAATAVFHHTDQGWQTRGRAIMNLDPDEAIEHFRGTLEAIVE